jgi:hypothetical protein
MPAASWVLLLLLQVASWEEAAGCGALRYMPAAATLVAGSRREGWVSGRHEVHVQVVVVLLSLVLSRGWARVVIRD